MSETTTKTKVERRPAEAPPLRPFQSAEEAWFWFMRCEKARAEGARPGRADAMGERPCEPDDIFRWVSQLYYEGEMFPLQLEVMGEYGYLDRLPYIDDDIEVLDYLIWLDAFETLEPFLRKKGVVA